MMRLARTSVLLSAACFFAGCETATPASQAVESSTQRSCVREPRTGSNLPSKECAATMSEAEKQQAIENMRVKNPSTSTVRSSSGG